MRTWVEVAGLSPLSDDEAERLAAAEYARMSETLHGLRPDEWRLPTPCGEWDVRALVAHVVGATEQYASLRKGIAYPIRAQIRARRTGGELVDALTGLQVEHHRQRPPHELVARFDAVRDRAARQRLRFPRVLRGVAVDDGFGNAFPLWDLMRIVATRDSWMHRDDLARATGRPMTLDAAHDGRLVADVVAEWARRHGRSFRLRLSGPAGGAYTAGGADTDDGGGTDLEMDAVAFCRALSGRGEADGLLAQGVPF